jgi:hypothetical protein
VNCRSSVESCQLASKPGSDVAPGSAWTKPAYGPGGVRHRGSVSLFRALMLNCGNLRRRWQAKGTSLKGEADSSEAPSRDGAARSSDEAAVTAAPRQDCRPQPPRRTLATRLTASPVIYWRRDGTKSTPYAGAHRSFGFVPISAKKASADIGPIRGHRQGSLHVPPQYDRRAMKASRGI